MQLVRLEVPVLRDPHTLHHFCDGGWDYWPGADRSVDVGDAIQKLLQAQPFLEELKFSNSDLSPKSAASLRTCLQPSDVPSLKSLQATPWVALAFLPVAPRLESLNLMLVKWGDGLLDEIQANSAEIKLSIRRFDIRVWYSKSDPWFWKNLAKVFALFPSTEQLSVAIDTKNDVALAEVYFEAIANNIYVLPSLREIEVRFETRFPNIPGILEVETQTIVDFKRACPLLETVVDPEGHLWTFRPERQSSGVFVPFLLGSLATECRRTEDLPAPREATHDVEQAADRLGSFPNHPQEIHNTSAGHRE
ncbi:hypothetical protein FS837_004054 [Tulasnella sp. UAMH 9824]|nr:hypothetical protein FS837_004054 [Tulasnella sp. UAMH 9824]